MMRGEIGPLSRNVDSVLDTIVFRRGGTFFSIVQMLVDVRKTWNELVDTGACGEPKTRG